MVVENKVIRTATWYRVSILVATALFSGVAIILYYTKGLTWLTLVSFLFIIIAILGVYEVFSSRIVLGDKSIVIVSFLSKRSFDKSQITTVSAEGGCVFLKIEGTDSWVKLPEMGRGALGMSNTIRAWLKRA